MNSAGACALLLAVWVGCQVFGGEALERLNIVKESTGGA